MANNNRYIITRSNYTLKSKHKSLRNGNAIYERDYMITTNLGGYDSGSIPWGEGNFKFTHNINNNNERSFNNGQWLTKPDGSTIWTLSDVVNDKPKEESQVVVKTNKNSFSDFVYFGSCVELVKSSLVNIVNYYPAELYVTTEKFTYINKSGRAITLGEGVFTNPVFISNPFKIDVSTKRVSDTVRQGDFFNELRYFAESLNKYSLIPESGDTQCFTGRDVVSKVKKCFNDGDLLNKITLKLNDGGNLIINEYYFTTGNVLITDGVYSNYRISLNEDTINDVFDEKLSPFERFLLNRDSKPIYTISVDVPKDTDYGVQITRETLTFPTQYGWNLDIVSGDYTKYVSQLSDIALAYDEHYSNNLWENIVHESIKNMDVNFSRPAKDEGIDDYRLGIGNVHGLMLAYGRQFDDIKLSIENIKSVNTVTYNENNNIPDYLLSDTLQLSGWEVSSAIKSLDQEVTVSDLYPGNTKEYTAADLNTEFMRNLKLNSKAILERKGNRQSIEMLLALFGMSSYEFGKNYYNCLPETSKIIEGGVTKQWDDLSEEQQSLFYDYKFNEYVTVAKNTSADVVSEDDTLPVEEVNANIKGGDVMTYNEDKCTGEQYENYNPLVGLPVRMVYITTESSGNTGETQTLKYIIPWFDKTLEYDGKTYFQMYGGWNKIEEYDNNHYTETLKYLNILSNIGQLSQVLYSDVSEGEIYYVKDITDYKTFYPNHPDALTPSHYFYLQNREKCYQYGDLISGTTYSDGWQIIPENDVEQKNGHGAEVYHIENIVDEYRGNNPHTGFGKYDDGDKYLKRLAEVFDGAIDDGKFEDTEYICETGEVEDWVREIGFDLTDKLVDNVKCWYFVDNTNPDKIISLQTKYTEIVDIQGDTYEIPSGYEESPITETVYVGKQAVENKEAQFSSDLDAFNLETQETTSNDEAAANSVINIKNISIEFNKYKYNTPEFQTYLHEVIMQYLNQIIPTTSMLTVKYIGDDEFTACDSTPVITGVSE